MPEETCVRIDADGVPLRLVPASGNGATIRVGVFATKVSSSGLREVRDWIDRRLGDRPTPEPEPVVVRRLTRPALTSSGQVLSPAPIGDGTHAWAVGPGNRLYKRVGRSDGEEWAPQSSGGEPSYVVAVYDSEPTPIERADW